ncbi:MAG: AAA family ATPase [Caldilineaceae bacterium]|nr:AAA family ATPase [Caldilineaceae bacterium]
MISSVQIRGFRSLAEFSLEEIPKAAVLIGANGSGKSNVLKFFEMLSWMVKPRQLGIFVGKNGGASDNLFGGDSVTPRLEASIRVLTAAGKNDYEFALAHAHPDRFIFTSEQFRFSSFIQGGKAKWQSLGSGHGEANIVDPPCCVNATTAGVIASLLKNCAVFQFHDTSDQSPIKKKWDITDNVRLRQHGGNLAPILFRLQHEDVRRYELICMFISDVLPEFRNFALEDEFGRVYLRWQHAHFDKGVGAHLTSDGSLRFFCLATLLNLPPRLLPDVILLDEPELGLHPVAIAKIGDMIRVLSKDKQVIVATQSPILVNSFEVDELFVLETERGRTEAKKFHREQFQVWLDDGYSPGELWRINLLGGRP